MVPIRVACGRGEPSAKKFVSFDSNGPTFGGGHGRGSRKKIAESPTTVYNLFEFIVSRDLYARIVYRSLVDRRRSPYSNRKRVMIVVCSYEKKKQQKTKITKNKNDTKTIIIYRVSRLKRTAAYFGPTVLGLDAVCRCG